VPFEREPRFAGEVKYTFRKSFGLAVTGIVSFSRVPLRLATYLGFLVAAFALVMIVVVVYWRLYRPQAPLIGYTIITAAIFFLAAVQLLCLGILGEYLGRVYDEVKGRPLFTLREVAGIEDRVKDNVPQPAFVRPAPPRETKPASAAER
jgi:dolichol-phosphate mannosyltransferase